MNSDYKLLANKIKLIGKELGFDQVGITDANINQESNHFKNWVKAKNHGEMGYFERHYDIYQDIEKLRPNTASIICCSIKYPVSDSNEIASFAQVPDYSSSVRKLLKKISARILEETKLPAKTRVFAGSAPILEKAFAAKAGLGWYGKNSILINEKFGSYFFLGEILTNLPLPIDQPIKNRCGDCFKCQIACPTGAITAPHKLDATRCISYLTIEHKGPIPLELRPLIETKVFGCDLCQQCCPWNKHLIIRGQTQKAGSDPIPSKGLTPPFGSNPSNILIEWFLCSEDEFLGKTAGTPIKRIGYERWLRNVAVALGNSPKTESIINALKSRSNHTSELVREHVKWALETPIS